ncbi:MAG: DUF86 domain-containing protein, partial [Armatimonadota bacterium]|nr:DUF86 domain-containing protein [Armatimonadota bacterium]
MLGRFNEALLAQRFAEIREARDLLEPYTRLSVEEFVANREAVDAAKYRLLVGVEACAQVCSHLLSRLTAQSPESVPACFQRLAELGVLPEELAQRLVRMARFRNLLVHRYQTIDNKQ